MKTRFFLNSYVSCKKNIKTLSKNCWETIEAYRWMGEEVQSIRKIACEGKHKQQSLTQKEEDEKINEYMRAVSESTDQEDRLLSHTCCQ